MNNKTIIFATITFLLAAFIFLSVQQKKQSDPNDKNFWILSFNDPKNNSLNFSIENHSSKTAFHWEVFSEKTKLLGGDSNVKKGETKSIPVQIEGAPDKKMTVIVTSGDEKKEIYKNL